MQLAGSELLPGDVVMDLIKELLKLCRRASYFKSTAEQLKSSIESLLPIVHQIQFSGIELPEPRKRQLDYLVHQLQLGLVLAQRASSSSRWNVYTNIRLSIQMHNLNQSIARFLNSPLQAHLLADLHQLRVDSAVRFDSIERKLDAVMGAVAFGEDERSRWVPEKERERENLYGFGSERVGKEKLKEMLMDEREEMRVVGVCGMGGCGKTTLVNDVCRDLEIKSHFGNRIIFETVSQSPNLEELKLKIWNQIHSGNHSVNGHDSVPQWLVQFEQNFRRPTLVVLDDVWSLSHLEQLILKIPGCKTLVASRFRFPAVINSTYEVELLKEEEALSLFCLSAFGQLSIPQEIDKRLVKQVAAECKGLPLALKVIGASLRGQPPIVWQSAKSRLSRGEIISDYHEAKLIERMGMSIEFLSNKVRECFLDLGSFPEDKKIPLNLLTSMWMELYDLNEVDALAVIFELADKNLLTLVKDAQAGNIYSSYNEFYVTQHDVLRDLALCMGGHGNINTRKRLSMPKREEGVPREWTRHNNCPYEAQIVSIHTGEMKESDWPQMNFPNAEVLLLTFSSTTYFLPPFVKTMPKLKILVLINYGIVSAAIQNHSVFASLGNLRTLWLEKITVPPLHNMTIPLLHLWKVSLILCEVNSLNKPAANLAAIFPRLTDLTMDHCIDLPELPSTICGVFSLESLSITNCHDLIELPPEIGRLNSLQILRVNGCPSLKNLPQEICRLKRLKYLDVSQCMNLRSLPEGIGEMVSLEKIDMRACSQIRTLPVSKMLMRSLGHVICDEGTALLWKEAEKALPELWIQVAEEQFTLDWLVE